jgi:hypothetical protein
MIQKVYLVGMKKCVVWQYCESKQEFKWGLCEIQPLMFIGHFEVQGTGSYK